MRADWGKMAEAYLAERRELVLSIHLIDARHEPTALDRQLHEWLIYNGKNHLIVATKADKLSNNQLQKTIGAIETALPESEIIAYSSVTGRGKDALWGKIADALGKNLTKD